MYELAEKTNPDVKKGKVEKSSSVPHNVTMNLNKEKNMLDD